MISKAAGAEDFDTVVEGEDERNAMPDFANKPRVKFGGKASSTTRPNGSIVFDIETRPLPIQTIRERSKPFTPPPPPGDFDESSVKLGNLKDPAKIEAKLTDARTSHMTSVKNYEKDIVQAERDYWQDIYDKSTLSPLLGRVLAIGIGHTNGHNDYLYLKESTDQEEADLLETFWQRVYRPAAEMGHSVIGHNIEEFDVPFLVRRSWLLGVELPLGLFRGRYLTEHFVDTRTVWNCGSRQSQVPGGLDIIAKSMGLGGKLEGISGGDFWKLFEGTAEERCTAFEYLKIDVDMTREVAVRLGVL